MSKRSPKYDRGSLITNLDLRLSQAELAQKVKLEEHMTILEDYMDSVDGTYGWQGAISRGGQLTIPKALEGKSFQSGDAERVSRVRARMQRGEPPLLVTMVDDTPVYSDEDLECYEDGYICSHCHQYQAVPNAPTCTWIGCIDNEIKGCGQQRY